MKALADGRTFLPEGSILKFKDGSSFYKILGEPVGYGGAGIIYPAVCVIKKDDQWQEEEMRVALKECCPLSTNGMLCRGEHGAIRCVESQDAFSQEYYAYAKEMMRKEKETTGHIFNKGFRLTPIWEIIEQEEIAIDGEHFYPAENQYGIMERLDEKGTSLGTILRRDSGGNLTAYQMVCILIQILQAVAEVHESGFLHGDIQENNIFLKGIDLSKEEEGVVTLIDFGTARPLLADGFTDIISDKKLFTTNGYCAPECSYNNDGTLRLSKAADLYSVGYLMLRMLNGKTVDTKALQLVINGKYIYARQAKKIGCPSGSLDAVNRILEKALKADPKERYQTAEDMLEDLKRVERALEPEKSAIASVDYEAFISYCHEEKSSWAAEQIQKRIERFKIPRVVQKMSGKKRMGKVFRDREELSSSSDMEVHLKEALDHSAFLIVLLSPKVPQSPWVAREMELFLQKHDREHILTILVDGTLEEAFPETLRKNEKFDGHQMKMQSVESLAADIRGIDKKESKKKLKTEIYRLLAPMLGCSYDDLRQRQKEYRMQRTIKMASASAVVLGAFAGYMGWQAAQIQKNYWETLEEKSRYLAKISGELLESGNRQDAILVAMEALPDGEKDKSKPQMPEAEAALSKALYSYQGWSSRSNYLRSYYMMQTDAPLTDLQSFDSESTQFLSVDKNYTLYVWNVADAVLRCKVESKDWEENDIEPEILCADFVDADTVRIITRTAIVFINLEDGTVKRKVLLEIALNSRGLSVIQCQICNQGKWLAVYDSLWNNERGSERTIQLFDLADGSLLRAVVMEEREDGVQSMHENAEIQVSPDGRYLAAAFYDFWEMSPEEKGVAIIYDTETEEFFTITSDKVGFYNLCFNEEHQVVIEGNSVKWGDIGEQNTTEYVACYDLQTRECIWEQELEWQSTFQASSDVRCGNQEGTVLVWNNRRGMVLKEETGEILDSFICAEQITGVENWGEIGYLIGTAEGAIDVYETGGLGFCEVGTNVQMDNEQILYDDEHCVAYLISKQDGAIACLAQVGDTNMKSFEVPYPIEADGMYRGEEKNYLILDGKMDEENRYYRSIYDVENNEEVYSYEIRYGRDNFILDEKTQMYYAWEYEDGKHVLHAASLEKGEEIWQERVDYAGDDATFYINSETEDNLMICRDSFSVDVFDLDTREWILKLDVDSLQTEKERSDRRINEVTIGGSGRYLLITEHYKLQNREWAEVHAYDRKTDTFLTLPEELQETSMAADYLGMVYMADQADLAAVYVQSEKQLMIWDLTENQILEKIPFQADSRRKIDFINENRQIILWGDDCYLKVWDRKEAAIKMVDRQKLYGVNRITANEETGIVEVSGYDEQDLEYVTGNEWNLYCYLMDEECGIYPYTKQWFGIYSPLADRFYVMMSGDTHVLYYDRYSLDELLEKARTVVGEKQLSEAEKIQYYIE